MRAKNQIEHMFSMYALDYVTLPAAMIYDDNELLKHQEVINGCHIYIVGQAPALNIEKVWADEDFIYFKIEVLKTGKRGTAKIKIPEKYTFVNEGSFGAYVIDDGDKKRSIPVDLVCSAISKQVESLDFEVLYIGQAYGTEGQRNALDRLRKHETLQKIALKGVDEGCELQLILLGLNSGNCVHTHINPFAEDDNENISDARIAAGLDFLYEATEVENVAVYEAALIRYFEPKYNKVFKDSFPSTNLKILNRCYEKDFQTVVAEINFDFFPYCLFSESVASDEHHMASFDLHKDEDRLSFFGKACAG